ncbi:ATP-grasp domain-containing protein, partial [Trichothermofontia sp.]
GKAGGVRFAENTIDAIAAAHAIFNLPIMGDYPEIILAEAKYDVDREFYLAVVLDTSLRRPVLLGSQEGGMNAAATFSQIQRVTVDQDFSPFYARRLAIKMGLKGKLIASVSTIIEKMYRLFLQQDLDLVEINPLGVSVNGEVMALDGKVTVNDAALNRHPHLASLTARLAPPPSLPPELGQAITFDLTGPIGLICNGMGLTLATVDLIYQAKGKPGKCLNLVGDAQQDWWLPPQTDQEKADDRQAHRTPALAIQSQLVAALNCLSQDHHLRVILIHLVSGLLDARAIVDTIATYCKRQARLSKSRSGPALVIRLLGPDSEATQATLAALAAATASNANAPEILNVPVFGYEILTEAIAQAIRLSQVDKANPPEKADKPEKAPKTRRR